MDIIFHVCLFVILAGLYFIYKFSSSHNPMIFVIIICSIGLIGVSQDDTYIVTGYQVNTTFNETSNTAYSTTQPIQESFRYEWILILSYWAMLLLSIINISTGEEYNRKKHNEGNDK